jgi:hypothetical protein
MMRAFTDDEFCERIRDAFEKGHVDLSGIPLSVKDWQQRDIPPPEYLLGKWFTTTSKAILSAETGLGKTNLILAAFAHMGLGIDFLHWKVTRPCLVLYIDGEMSRRQLKVRIEDCARRLDLEGDDIPGLLALSHEDIKGWQPLNSEAGQTIFAALLGEVERRYGRKPDAICFDNVMSLVAGSMKDEEAWQEVLPLIQTLVEYEIGQVWIHHTGHDTTKGYGTKTREWLLDTAILLQKVTRPDTDVSFSLEFTKARERTPETRRDFEEVSIALVNDQWETSAKAIKKATLKAANAKFLDALTNCYASGATETMEGKKVVRVDIWRGECERLGLIERDKTDKARAWFSKNKRQLIEGDHIASHYDDFVWKL